MASLSDKQAWPLVDEPVSPQEQAEADALARALEAPTRGRPSRPGSSGARAGGDARVDSASEATVDDVLQSAHLLRVSQNYAPEPRRLEAAWASAWGSRQRPNWAIWTRITRWWWVSAPGVAILAVALAWSVSSEWAPPPRPSMTMLQAQLAAAGGSDVAWRVLQHSADSRREQWLAELLDGSGED